MKAYREIWEKVIDEHRQVFAAQDEGQLDAFMELIAAAERVFVLGAGREGIAARSFAMRLMHLGKETHWVWDDTCPGMRGGDLFIAVNGGGDIGHINYIMGEARKTGARVAAVTGSPSGSGIRLADFALFVPAAVYKGKDKTVPSIQPMGNLFEQHLFLLFDIVVMLLEDRLGVDHAAMESRHRNVE